MKRWVYGTLAAALLVANGTDAQQLAERQHTVRESLANTEYGSATAYRLPALGATAASKSRQQPAEKNSSSDFTFRAVDVTLDGDYDGDGYYYVLDLDWDADTVFSTADVYGVVWLSYEGGAWEEFLTTSVYTLHGASSGDRYRVRSELESGYPTGTYDVLLELYDPASGQFLAELGPADTLALAQLPLEDLYHDDEDEHLYGGSLGPLSLATLLLALALTGRRALIWARRGLRHGLRWPAG